MLTSIKDIGRWISAIVKGQYKNYGKLNLILIVLFTLYVFSPIDIVPDFIFLLGWIDDALIIRIGLYVLKKEISKFKKSEYYSLTYQKIS